MGGCEWQGMGWGTRAVEKQVVPRCVCRISRLDAPIGQHVLEDLLFRGKRRGQDRQDWSWKFAMPKGVTDAALRMRARRLDWPVTWRSVEHRRVHFNHGEDAHPKTMHHSLARLCLPQAARDPAACQLPPQDRLRFPSLLRHRHAHVRDIASSCPACPKKKSIP